MLHGIGAETPTQIVVLAAAAGAGGGVAGVLFLAVFLAGLFCSNTLVALGAVAGLFNRERAFPLYAGLSVVVAGFSLVIGVAILAGRGDGLPSLLGG
jgi:high-affinity nickel-transport protein